MKKLSLILCATYFSVTAFSQSAKIGLVARPPLPSHTMTSEEFNVKVIKYLLTFPSPLQNGSVQLHRMGDRAAGYMLTILKSRPPLNSAEQQTALDIVKKAYEKPAAIINLTDRTSTAATMSLLQEISETSQDFAVKLRIADIKQSVLDTASAR